MNIIGCLDVPTSGTYLLDGRDVGQMDTNQLAAIRNELLGFIFQQYNLLPKLDLLENVEVPLMYAGVPKAERRQRAREVLEQVGLGDKLHHLPNQLSGGQQQRVSIARALAGRPAVILADEPTGALDSHTSREVLGMLQDLHRQGNTVVLITHDNSIAVQAQRIIRLEDGHVVYDGDARAPEAVVTPGLRGRCVVMSLWETFYACCQKYLRQQNADLSHHAGHHHRRVRRHRHRGPGQRYGRIYGGQLRGDGDQHLTVSIMGRGTSRTVSEEQMYQIVEDNAGYLDQISPTVSMTGSVKIGSTTYSSTSVSGVGGDVV